ncbi:MAG: hypothetical protein KAX49_14840, partial [Halanaerobiales bacterium]|nr:hypothetical protein [Halanaerobiales bacterium]
MLKELHTVEKPKESKVEDIAIIGLACKFAEAQDKDQFWQVLREGKDCIRKLPKSRKENVDEYLKFSGLTLDDVIIREGGYLEEIDKFDYAFFKISPKEASLMDPNQRLFLETAWRTIEDAGYAPSKLAGTNTGVFVGYSHDFGDSYKKLIHKYAPESLSMATLGNINSVITGRISYLLDLRGPSMLVDTACSSSLLAVHLAAESIKNGDCEMAIAGGVKLWLIPVEPKDAGEFGGEAGPGIGIESKDGRARTFDDNTTGTGFGEGVGAVLLKPLKKAIEDGDRIYAVIKGSATNHDGKSIGISAPNVEAQEAVIQKAWKRAGINPETISYIEAHGTGTKLGDPLEIYALQNSFAKHTKKKHFCAVGSAKSNVGHLDNAAGIVGLIKVILALKNREIPASLHFKKPNKEIDFLNSSVYVNDELRPWLVEKEPRRAGVSSFGLSGTNVHLVLEEVFGETLSEDSKVNENIVKTQFDRKKCWVKPSRNKVMINSDNDDLVKNILSLINDRNSGLKKVTNLVIKEEGSGLSATERKVAAIWAEILGMEEISIYDNFYDLGGDSIIALSIASIISKEFNIELSLDQIFRSPTIFETSKQIDSSGTNKITFKKISRRRES